MAVPKLTIRTLSTRAGSRRASLAPAYPPTIVAGASVSAAPQWMGAKSAKTISVTKPTDGGEDILEGVDAVQVFVEDQGEGGDIHDAEGGAEIAAVDRAEEDHELQGDALPAGERARG